MVNFSESEEKEMQGESVRILDVRIDNMRSEEAQEAVAKFICGRDGQTSRVVFFANVHSIHLARQSRYFLQTLEKADLVLPDGSGLKIAGQLFGSPIRENLNGTDFTPEILREAEREGWTVFLFGGAAEVMERLKLVLSKKFPRLKVAGASPGFLDSEAESQVLDEIRKLSPEILLVGLGSPRQEEWIMRHAPDLRAGVCMAVGGLFDFMAGRFRRAPRWLRAAGLEWVYRFLQDPKTKWDRVFIEIPQFLVAVILRAFFPRSGWKFKREST
jgi:N-acetylglucosaminyldiphosphoundecaprenol N-acetyl-beta-D-mannosaminyltransferase